MNPSLFHWAGRRVLSDTVMLGKRTVVHADGQTEPCQFDIRRWVMPPEDDLMRDTWRRLAKRHQKPLAAARGRSSIDTVAKVVWHFVVEHVQFTREPQGEDFWQLPPETLVLGHGDCEDQAFLAASVLLAAGVAPDRVRVVLGGVLRTQPRAEAADRAQHALGSTAELCGHAWPMYRDSRRRWHVLETGLKHLPIARPAGNGQPPRVVQASRPAPINRVVFLPADRMAADGRRHQYVPLLCLNHRHVWSVPETNPGTVAAACRLQPDWSRLPSFRQLLATEQKLIHADIDFDPDDDLLE